MNEPQSIDWKKFSDRSKKVYYFEKWIFRCVVFSLIVLFGVSLYLNGFDDKIYAKCPDGLPYCNNPFYERCDDLDKMFKGSDESVLFARSLCEQEFLLGSVVVGEPPSWFMRNYLWLVFGLLALGFLINHFAFNSPRQLQQRRVKVAFLKRAEKLEAKK